MEAMVVGRETTALLIGSARLALIDSSFQRLDSGRR
jgi:hypothetical protein